jgi:hypothetical protein
MIEYLIALVAFIIGGTIGLSTERTRIKTEIDRSGWFTLDKDRYKIESTFKLP